MVHTVRSVEGGAYGLSDGDTKIDQWQLLECRCTKDEDNAPVTLEEDQRKYNRGRAEPVRHRHVQDSALHPRAKNLADRAET